MGKIQNFTEVPEGDWLSKKQQNYWEEFLIMK